MLHHVSFFFTFCLNVLAAQNHVHFLLSYRLLSNGFVTRFTFVNFFRLGPMNTELKPRKNVVQRRRTKPTESAHPEEVTCFLSQLCCLCYWD